MLKFSARAFVYRPPKRKIATERKAGEKKNQLFLLIRLTMTLTIVSFSSVRLSAIIKVRYSLVCAKFAHVVSRFGIQTCKMV